MTTTPDTRQLRAPLSEIPDRLETTSSLNSPSVPSSLLSPAPSPDEFVIRQRGRKPCPVTWSPDIELKRNSTFYSVLKTPPKGVNKFSPTKKGIQLRVSPRKRLILEVNETPDIGNSIDNTSGEPSQKIPKSANYTPFQGPIDFALKALSQTQLIDIIKDIVTRHPEIEEELKNNMPLPDIQNLEKNIRSLKVYINRSLPTSRLVSKSDALAYSKAALHINAFKNCVVDQGKVLVQSQQWESVIQYVFIAWSHVQATPVWDNKEHNHCREQCFKNLNNFCLTALKKGNFDCKTLRDIEEKVQRMLCDYEEAQSCLKYLHGKLEFSN